MLVHFSSVFWNRSLFNKASFLFILFLHLGPDYLLLLTVRTDQDMDTAVFVCGQELYELKYTLNVSLKTGGGPEVKHAALQMARMEVANKPWLKSLLPDCLLLLLRWSP